MIWFRKKQTPDVPVAPSIPFGSLRIAKAWSGHYVIEQYRPQLIGTHFRVCWNALKEAGRFDTPEAAIERIRFMGMTDMLITSEAP